MTETGGLSTGYAAATADVRSTARWLAAAGASVAAVLVAGVNIRGVPLADLSKGRLLLAAVSLLIAYGLAVWLVLAASAVLTRPRLSLNDLADEEMLAGGLSKAPRLHPLDDELVQFLLDRKTDLLAGETSIHQFYRRYGTFQARADGDAHTREEGSKLVARVEEAVQYVQVECAFAKLKAFLPWGAAAFAVAVIAFVAASTPTDQAPAVRGPVAVDVHIVDGRVAGLPESCPAVLRGVAVGGTLAEPDVVTQDLPQCPTARLSDNAGVIVVPRVK